MKILITGAKGMLGADLCRVLKKEGHETIETDQASLDITLLSSVLDNLEKSAPECIINCAAYTDVDGCETEADTAYRVNAIGPKNLAVAADRMGCSLVHIGTDFIFDGKKTTPYMEDDSPNPLNVYGGSKLAGEKNVMGLCNRYYIVRTQWLYGENGKNFVDAMLDLAKEGNPLTVVNDQFGSPTYTGDLAAAIARLIQTPNYGVYHLTNAGVTTKYDFAKQILELAGLEPEQVSPCSTARFPRPATRPAYAPLENYNWKLCGYTPVRPYREALREYLYVSRK